MASSAQPRIAVIIPCFNDGATIEATVQSATEQEPCELVVVDDGSTDAATREALERLSERGHQVIFQENQGVSAARMAGVAATSAPYIFPLDSDDRIVPGSLAQLADALDARPEDAVCWGDARTFGDIEIVRRSAETLDPWLISYVNPMSYSALFRREAIEVSGGWQLKGGYEDWDLWMGIAEHGFTGFRVPVPSFLYRIHGQRFWAEAVQRHDAIHAILAERHRDLFAARRSNRVRSDAPLRVRFGLPITENLPLLSSRAKRRLSYTLREPTTSLAFGADRLRAALRRRRGENGVDTLVLCYHAVSETWPASLSVTPAVFEEQIAGLLRRGYQGVTLSASRQAPRAADKLLVVTFDDGYSSTLTEAAPILERLDVPGTLFVPTDHIGRPGPMCWQGIDNWSDGPHRAELEPLTWDQVRELAAKGWEIGSHSVSHPHLPEIGDEELSRELTASKEKIASELGRPCTTVAYPYGDVDDRVAAAAEAAGYEIGVDLPHRWRQDEEPLRVPRVGVYNNQPKPKLALKFSPRIRRLRVAIGR
jgi:peptidoglycan/xylan/chitin deacetylase (PgdA/CDA1 family)/glycosyltransferase involved in cell wall biosynthesis